MISSQQGWYKDVSDMAIVELKMESVDFFLHQATLFRKCLETKCVFLK